jgi:thioester reductase-like protein
VSESCTVLVTGAAGLVGAELTVRLAAAGHSVVAVVHNNTELVRNDGRQIRACPWEKAPALPGTVRTLHADVTKPALGLAEPVHAELARQVDRIAHCAAVTEFGHPSAVYESVNVRGTANVLAFAGATSKPLVHLSTAYVCGERDGVVTEDELDVGQTPGNPYEASKLRAEKLVRRAHANGLPVAVVRPTIVVGAERSGAVREFKNIYTVLKLTTENKVRQIPGRYDATLDLVPVDYVADLTAEVVARLAEVDGVTLHAVGGALTLRDFSDVMAEYPSFHVPRFQPPAGFDVERLPLGERMYHERIVSLYQSYFRRGVRFDASAAEGFRVRRRVRGGKPLLRKVFDYAIRAGYLGTAERGVEQVLAELREGADDA